VLDKPVILLPQKYEVRLLSNRGSDQNMRGSVVRQGCLLDKGGAGLLPHKQKNMFDKLLLRSAGPGGALPGCFQNKKKPETQFGLNIENKHDCTQKRNACTNY
jgi:hypothetical protein